MFGAFFFVPDLTTTRYLKAGKQALSKLVYNAGKDRVVVPIQPPVKDDLDDILDGTFFAVFISDKFVFVSIKF